MKVKSRHDHTPLRHAAEHTIKRHSECGKRRLNSRLMLMPKLFEIIRRGSKRNSRYHLRYYCTSISISLTLLALKQRLMFSHPLTAGKHPAAWQRDQSSVRSQRECTYLAFDVPRVTHRALAQRDSNRRRHRFNRAHKPPMRRCLCMVENQTLRVLGGPPSVSRSTFRPLHFRNW